MSPAVPPSPSTPIGAGIRVRATGLEAPVFHDATGRRRRVIAVGGWLAALLTALWLSGMVVGASGFATLPSVGRLLAHPQPFTVGAGHRAFAATPGARSAAAVPVRDVDHAADRRALLRHAPHVIVQ
jgi:hypothetical protein